MTVNKLTQQLERATSELYDLDLKRISLLQAISKTEDQLGNSRHEQELEKLVERYAELIQLVEDLNDQLPPELQLANYEFNECRHDEQMARAALEEIRQARNKARGIPTIDR